MHEEFEELLSYILDANPGSYVQSVNFVMPNEQARSDASFTITGSITFPESESA